jgi:SAM-dependent methyltransferase
LDSIEDWDMWYRLHKFGLSFKCTDIRTFKYFVGNDTSASKSGKKLEILRSKHDFKMKGLNLNLACGGDYQPDYINVDLYPTDPSKIDAQFDVKDIPYEDNTIDTIRAMHIIEHFSFKESQKVLQEWCRVLKPGGKLIIETPDFLTTCKRFVESDEGFRVTLYGHIFSTPDIPGMIHKFLFTETQLRCQLNWAGFKNITRVKPTSSYVHPEIVDLFLAMEAEK